MSFVPKPMIKVCALVVLALFVRSARATVEASSADTNNEILEHYLSATQAQQTHMLGMSMDVSIDASVPNLQKKGRLQALRNISRLGQITYRALNFVGDKTIKNDVIARYLTAETQATNGQAAAMAINPRNYKFKYKGVIDRAGYRLYLFELTPRKKQVGLFKGHLWVDGTTYLPVRESGRMVRNPSIFLKKVEFVRDYEIRDGVAYPRRIKSMIFTRLVGPAELSIDFSNYREDDTSLAAATPAETQ